MEYYVFETKEQADTCIATINGSGWFPIVGNRKGKPDATAQQTTKWCENAIEMASGEWAVPRIPINRLDYIGVPEENRIAFMTAFGSDIRDLTTEDFPVVEDDELEITAVYDESASTLDI